MPPAGTVFCVQPVCTPPENTGLQQPTWIEPGVLGARCPCRSLIASSWTCVSDCAATAAPGGASRAVNTSAVLASLFIDLLRVSIAPTSGAVQRPDRATLIEIRPSV